MAEIPNRAEQKMSTLAEKRKASLAALSKIIKAKTSLYQSRALTATAPRRSSSGRLKFFLLKTAIGLGSIYLSALMGVWGDPHDSTKLVENFKKRLSHIEQQAFIPPDIKFELANKINKSKEYVQKQVEVVPQEIKSYYVKSEKRIMDLFKRNE